MKEFPATGTAIGVFVAGATIDIAGVRPLLDVQASAYVLCGVIDLVAVARVHPRPRRRLSTPLRHSLR